VPLGLLTLEIRPTGNCPRIVDLPILMPVKPVKSPTALGNREIDAGVTGELREIDLDPLGPSFASTILAVTPSSAFQLAEGGRILIVEEFADCGSLVGVRRATRASG